MIHPLELSFDGRNLMRISLSMIRLQSGAQFYLTIPTFVYYSLTTHINK
jgi:hypothetical protein